MDNSICSATLIDKLVSVYSTPVYLYDGDGIIQNSKKFMEAFKSHIPKFKQYFAVKATPNKHILELVKNEGMGFDCSSITELELVDNLCGSSEIIYTSNYTSVEDFEIVLKMQHHSNSQITINLDDIDGLENLCQASKNTNLKLPDLISFRLNPLFGSTNSEVSSNVLGGSNTKFGVPSTRIIEAYNLAQIAGFTKFGIHVMTGSCILEISYFEELVNVIFSYINDLHTKLGITFEFVDLGGGIGIPYKPTQNAIDIDLLAKTISDAIDFNKSKYGLLFDPVIAMENGRYITGPYGYLITKCKSIKEGVDGKKFYGLDACMANLMRPGMYGAYHKITVPRLLNSNEENNIIQTEQAHVVGTLCENNDWFAKNRDLPFGIKKEDIFVIHDAGAHGFSMGFQYNGKLRSAEVLAIGGELKEIRQKESHCFN